MGCSGLLEWVLRRDLMQMENKKVIKDGSVHQGDMAASEGKLVAIRRWKRQGKGFHGASGETPAQLSPTDNDFGLLVSRTVRE